jgi:type II secretory pathway component PulJ
MNKTVIVALALLGAFLLYRSHQYSEAIADERQQEKAALLVKISLMEQKVREVEQRIGLLKETAEQCLQREIDRVERERAENRIRAAETIRALQERADLH